ncbi:MAG: hypothetical protein MI749_18540 [Desulfovibrionales bacterium]|nr:hypothetical protein [Desulfovibrionales bacterium]
MPLVERSIHLFSLSRPVNTIEANSLSIWFLFNPEYTVTLWTVPEHMSESVLVIHEALLFWPQITNIQIDRSDDKLTYWLEVTAAGVLDTIRLTLQSIWSIPKIPQTESIFERELTRYRFGIATNIARWWVLKRFGGMYISWNIRPRPQLQNTYIFAQRDILFSMKFSTTTIISNDIIGVVKNSPVIDRMLNIMIFLYNNTPAPAANPKARPEQLSFGTRFFNKLFGTRDSTPQIYAHDIPPPLPDEETRTGTAMIAEFLRSVGINPDISPWDFSLLPQEHDDHRAMDELRQAIEDVDAEEALVQYVLKEKKLKNKWRERYSAIGNLKPLTEGEEIDFRPPPPVEKIIANEQVTHLTYSFKDRSKFKYDIVEHPDNEWHVI